MNDSNYAFQKKSIGTFGWKRFLLKALRRSEPKRGDSNFNGSVYFLAHNQLKNFSRSLSNAKAISRKPQPNHSKCKPYPHFRSHIEESARIAKPKRAGRLRLQSGASELIRTHTLFEREPKFTSLKLPTSGGISIGVWNRFRIKLQFQMLTHSSTHVFAFFITTRSGSRRAIAVFVRVCAWAQSASCIFKFCVFVWFSERFRILFLLHNVIVPVARHIQRRTAIEF